MRSRGMLGDVPSLAPRLILSVDQVAAVRALRKEQVPDPVHFALEAEAAGMEGIKAHLRLDRCHIQDSDIELLNKMAKTEFFLQIAMNQDVVHLVNTFRPRNVILVAERRDESGTETGLDVTLLAKQLLNTVREIDSRETRIFLAIDPVLEQIRSTAKLEVHGVCISLRDHLLHGGFQAPVYSGLKAIREAVRLSVKYGMETHLFNSISWNVLPVISSIPGVSAIHLGHHFLADCMYKGIAGCVQHYRNRLEVPRDAH